MSNRMPNMVYDPDEEAREAEANRDREGEWEDEPVRSVRSGGVKVTLSTRVDPELLERLEQIAQEQGSTLPDVVRTALSLYSEGRCSEPLANPRVSVRTSSAIGAFHFVGPSVSPPEARTEGTESEEPQSEPDWKIPTGWSFTST